MSDDEQGYAPASYLEPVEESSDLDVHPEDLTNQSKWAGLDWQVNFDCCLQSGAVNNYFKQKREGVVDIALLANWRCGRAGGPESRNKFLRDVAAL